MTILRVFPRRTSATPDDALAWIGAPNLWTPQVDEVHVSVTFTWDLAAGYALANKWRRWYGNVPVNIGGPAIPGNCVDGFTPGLYIKHGYTFTSRGCPNNCPWCLVRDTEGPLRTLPIVPGWIVQDNNLAACPHEHIEAVFDMLRAQRHRPIFSGGIQASLVDDWLATQFAALWHDRGIEEIYLACDTSAALGPLKEAVARLNFLKRDQLRCYVMIGRDETIGQALERLESVWRVGCMPFAQLYQPADELISYSREWKELQRAWARPAITRAMHKEP